MKILIDIPDEQIEKSLEESKYIHENEGEKGSVKIVLLYTNKKLEFVDISRKTDFYSLTDKYTILDKSCKTCMSEDELDKITEWLISHIFRNSDIMFNDEIRGNVDAGEETDMCFIIASLHNMLYKEVTGEYYDYMFHWANKIGAWVYDDLFKKEGEKNERY